MIRNVYDPYDFEAHKNLSHKQFPISVYYFMNGAVYKLYSITIRSKKSLPRTGPYQRCMVNHGGQGHTNQTFIEEDIISVEITEIETEIKVQWQNGEISSEPSVNLTPALHINEHDFRYFLNLPQTR